MSKNNISEAFVNIIKNMADMPILVVGDIMLDRFVYGSVDRISPESPVPVLSILREDQMLGGAGNALANLAGLKAQGKILSVIGDDEDGHSVRGLVESLGFESTGLIVDNDRPTTVKTRFLSGHQQLLRCDFEKKTELSDTIIQQLTEAAKTLIQDVKAVLISDYGKGLLQPEFLATLIGLARDKNIPVIVDPKGQDYSRYQNATAITPNRKELSEATRGLPTDTDEDVIATSETLIKDCHLDVVVATRSKDGMTLVQKGQAAQHFHSPDIEVFDVSGAGDTVIATIAAALAAGAEWPEATELANLAGSLVVTKVGTAPIRMEELEQAVRDGNTDRQRSAPLADWPEAEETVKRWRARDLKIGFTNGCFDILHKGHVEYLNAARAQCDRLVVGLNTDSSVRILKGPDRPVHDERSRAAVLSALASVDLVILFGGETAQDDNTANALLSLLQPDVYFKGGDYTVDQIPEAPTVQSYGGEVSIMPESEGFSTSSSVAKIKSSEAA